jgi:protein TonB
MFEQTFVDTRVPTRKPAAVAASVFVQSAAVGGLLLIPLLQPVVRRRERAVWHNPLAGPVRVPDRIVRFVDEPDAIAFAMPGLSAVAETVINMVLPEATPPVPPPPVKPVETRSAQPVSVSKGVQAARLIFGPKPEYPTLAKAARVQGTVHLRAIIGTDGSVRNLAVQSGPPLLIKAAMEAVSRWRYQPTLLTGAPVEVTTEIDVNFTLSQ